MVGRTVSSEVRPHAAPSEAAQQVATWRLRSRARSRPLLCSLFTITERHGGGGGGAGGGEGINPHSGVNPRLLHHRPLSPRRRESSSSRPFSSRCHGHLPPKTSFLFTPSLSLTLSSLSLPLSCSFSISHRQAGAHL